MNQLPKCDCGGQLKQFGVTMSFVCQWCGNDYDVEELPDLEAAEQRNEAISDGQNYTCCCPWDNPADVDPACPVHGRTVNA